VPDDQRQALDQNGRFRYPHRHSTRQPSRYVTAKCQGQAASRQRLQETEGNMTRARSEDEAQQTSFPNQATKQTPGNPTKKGPRKSPTLLCPCPSRGLARPTAIKHPRPSPGRVCVMPFCILCIANHRLTRQCADTCDTYGVEFDSLPSHRQGRKGR